MKTVGKILLALIAVPVIAVLALVLLVDVNRFKPHIENAAKEQGIALSIKGDLGWNLWPSIGVEINDLSVVALATPQQPLAELTRASLLLKLMPLFSGDFQVDHLLVDGARINLAVDKTGTGNWEALTKTDTNGDAKPATAETSTDPAADLTLDIQDISLTNSQVNYSDAQSGQTLALRAINLHLTDVNTRAEPFPLTLALNVEMAQDGAAPLLLDIALNNTLSLNAQLSDITLSDGELQLGVGKAAPLVLGYQMALSDVQNKPAYKGQLRVKETNLRGLLAALGTELETANSDALTQFSFSAAIDGNDQQVQLTNLVLQLDKTRFDGALAITDLATSALKVDLKGDSINVDDYLPPPSDTEATESTAAQEDTPLPLEAIRALNLNAKFALQRMIIKQMALENILLTVNAKNGVVDQNLTAKAYQGEVKFTSKTDARSDKAALNFDGAVQGFELAPLLKDLQMDEKISLSGALQANTQGAAQGATVNQLMASMNSTANFSGAQVRLAPLNIEEQFCKLVNLVTQNQEQVTWDAFTEMRQLDGNIVWRDQVISLNSFNAGVSQLLLASTGQINLANDQYEFKLPIKIASASAAAQLKGCSLGTTNYWVDRGLSLLRCKGSVGALDPVKDCGFDKSALGDLTKDFAEYKLREKHGAKIEEAEQKVEAKKQEVKQQVEEKKQELINKLQNKLFKTPASAAASSSATEAAAE
ncbi:AsmA family protein [Cellvibrio fontiphilus]|uniref:AsmA family protein n=1 Tax=Cellvibrio fontiphilus TaxID=1815559 RepID=A0ABV7FIV5_9GAMM